MPTFELAKIENFISVEEQQELRNIAISYHESGVLEANPRGPGRYRAKIWDTPHCTAFIRAIGDRVIECFKLQGAPVDRQLGWIVSLLQNGAQIHPHRDRYPYHEQAGTKHLRCNIMVSRENNSGNPVIAGNVIDVPERALWGFFPSEVEHSTGVIQTREPRIAFQFGFTVPGDYTFAGIKKALSGAP